jgi:hypothetical protein
MLSTESYCIALVYVGLFLLAARNIWREKKNGLEQKQPNWSWLWEQKAGPFEQRLTASQAPGASLIHIDECTTASANAFGKQARDDISYSRIERQRCIMIMDTKVIRDIDSKYLSLSESSH